MGAVTHTAYGSLTTVLSTELNSLANNANTAASAAYDNSSNRDLFCDMELVVNTQGSARSTGATVDVFMLARADGANYPSLQESVAELVASFPLDAATTSRRAVIRDIPLPPASVQFFARNRTGQALASSANTVKIVPHSLTVA